MKPLGDPNTHYWLAQRMARANHIDLAGAVAHGDLDQEHWADLVQNCRSCPWTEGCKRWLNAPSHETVHIPMKCHNHDRLAALQAAGQEADAE
jgi:hypothetical protein